MLKKNVLHLILFCCFGFPLMAGTTLLLPPKVTTNDTDIVEGLALTLAMNDLLAQEHQLIPFTAVRKKLESMNLPISGPVTLATQFRIAEQLGGLKVIHLEQNQDKVTFTSYDVPGRFLLSRYVLQEDTIDFEALAKLMAGDLTDTPVALDNARIAYYRVWASAYLAPDQQAMQEIMDRLLQTPFVDWLLLQEYVDLFGDPAESQEDVESQTYWRDFYLKNNYFQGALNSSQSVLDARHNPADLVIHARILLALGEGQEACGYLTQADQFGFDLGDLRDHFETCRP